jgi:hypothetical protein
VKVLKIVQWIIGFLVRPQKRRWLSYIDLVVLFLLGGMVTVHFVFNAVQASQTDSTRTSQVNSHLYTLAIPKIPAAKASSSTPTDPCIVDPNCSAVNKPDAPNNVKGPFGKNDLVFFFTDPAATVGEPHVQALWGLMRDAVNAFIVLLLILTGMRIMLAGSVFRYANAIEVLPAILLALLAANFSLNIATFSLGLNNAFSTDIYNQANKMAITSAQYNGQDIVTKTCNGWLQGGATAAGTAVGSIAVPGIGGILGGIAGGFLGHWLGCDVDPHVKNWNQTLVDSAKPPDITGGMSITGIATLFSALSNLLGFIAGILVLMLMGQMVIRLFFIDLYIILAPLGIACWALPGRAGQSLTRLWIQGFFSTIFVQFLQVMALIVLRILVGRVTSDVYASFNSDATNSDATLLWVIQIAQYWFLIRIPSLLGGAPMNMLVSFGQTMAQAAQTAVTITAAEVQFATSVVTSAAGAAVGIGVAAAAR